MSQSSPQRSPRVSHHAWISRHAGQVGFVTVSDLLLILFRRYKLSTANICRVEAPTDIPNEAGEFAGNGGDNLRLRLAKGSQPSIALAKTSLRLPCNGPDLFRKPFDPCSIPPLFSCWQTIGPGRFDQHRASLAIAAFRNGTTPMARAARRFRGDKSEPTHQLLRRSEA
jgi:hypothetical protein